MKLLLPLVAILSLVGCSQSTPPTAAKPGTEPGKTGGPVPPAAVGAGASGTEPAKDASNEAPKPKPILPAELKNDAYDYYGLGLTEPVPMEVVMQGQPTRTGTQLVQLKEVSNDVAVYEITRTGSLADLGSMQVELKKDGIFVRSSSIGEIEGSHLELPSGLHIGKSWTSTLKIKGASGTVENSSTFKIVRTESVTTKVGKYNALLITSVGPATIAGQKSQMSTKGWFVKGRGAVKMIIVTKPASGPSTEMTIQETK